eukprot:4991088-Pyramimonas_sp.AAC.1
MSRGENLRWTSRRGSTSAFSAARRATACSRRAWIRPRGGFAMHCIRCRRVPFGRLRTATLRVVARA